jgi:hypothetical protein
VSSYELTRALPASLKSALPTVEEIEAELAVVEPAADDPKVLEDRSPKKRTKKKRKTPRPPEEA